MDAKIDVQKIAVCPTVLWVMALPVKVLAAFLAQSSAASFNVAIVLEFHKGKIKENHN